MSPRKWAVALFIIIPIAISMILYVLVLYCVIKVEFAVVIVALFLGTIGIFRDWITSLFLSPKLEIEFKVEPPAFQSVPCNVGTVEKPQYVNSYYYRLKIKNVGNYRAKNVEVMLEKYIKAGKGNHRFEKDTEFLPMNLRWTNTGETVRESIAPKLSKFCDFGFILDKRSTRGYLNKFPGLKECNEDSKVVLALKTEVEPNTGSHILFPGKKNSPVKYYMKIIAVADNSRLRPEIFEISLKDYWSEDKDSMRKNCLLAKSSKESF